MNADLLSQAEEIADLYLPKAVPLDKDNPAAFFGKHLKLIASLIKMRENLGSAMYEVQFEEDWDIEWASILEASLVKMGYYVTLSINQYKLATFIIRWQAIAPPVDGAV